MLKKGKIIMETENIVKKDLLLPRGFIKDSYEISDFDIPFGFSDNRDDTLHFPNKPDHVLLLYRNLQVGLCTDTEIVFPNAVLKCHRWIIDAYIGWEHLKTRPTSLEKFVSEYFCCLKAPELPMVLRAYYRSSDTHDIFVHIGDEEFKCHFDVLQCYTNFFNQRNRFDIVDLPESEVSIRAFFMIYKGLMLDQIPEIPFRGIMEVFKAAKYLQIEFLIKNLVASFKKLEEEEKKKGLANYEHYEPPKLINKFFVKKV